ncbi:unnamed protein product [Pocillopora meandrina]|uniref:Uncharacterized protein n=1 Tax=Pocillopora meandrina TaxID=46732 RepID=A0AAU9VTS8_9CNID|nr:unnamed protein product [Pocillopora meandrina]
MIKHAIFVYIFVSLMLGSFAHPILRTRLSQDMSGTRQLLEEPGMTKCPHPSDIYFCTFEFLYNEACYEGTEEFKIRCQNFCNGLCRIYGTLS